MIIFSDSRDPIFNSRDPDRECCYDCRSDILETFRAFMVRPTSCWIRFGVVL